MANYDPSKAQFWFEIAGRPDDTFALADFYGIETLSQPFRFELNLISPVDNDLNLPDLLNQPSKLVVLRDGDHKELHGILSDLEEVGRGKDFAFYRAVLVPRLWRLSLNYQSRVFQNKSVPDILTEVLKGGGLSADDFKLSLKATYQPREYCVQYRETDLNFISRLMEHEGITFFFDHADGKDVMVIVDDNSNFRKIEAPDEIKSFVGEGFQPSDQETVHELAWREKVVTGKVVLKDYNYRTPETTLSAESQLDQKSPGLYYDYGDHFKTATDGKALAKIRNQEIESARRVVTGASDCRGFHAGGRFTLQGHYRDALNVEYLLTQVSHFGSQAGGMGTAGDGSASGPSYRNEFSCMPATVQYRPPRTTPEPRIPGIMTARVESAGGEYAHLDEEGRYRVKMPFDLSDSGQARASRAIRLAQPYSGSGYGMHFPVHAGAELVWACVDGNVDRPLGLSTVPNPSSGTPVSARNKTQNIIRSASGNELVMEDMKDEAHIALKTTDNHMVLLDDKDDKIDIVTTKKNRMTLDDKNQNITIQTTNGHLLVMDDKNTKITVQSKNGHYLTIDDSDGAESITLTDKDRKNCIIIDITHEQLLIKTADGDIGIQAPNGEISIQAHRLEIKTGGDTEIKAANIKAEADSEMKLKATTIKEEADTDLSLKGMNVKSEASMGHKISGANVSSEASINQEVKGNMVTIQSAGPNTIKGMPVMIN